MSSALAAELREHFDFGDVDAPEIGQCAELCKRYATNAEDLAAEWDLHSKKMGKVLSLATLEEFRMQVLEKKATRQQLALSRQQFASRPAGRPVALTKESLHLLAAPDGRKRGRDSDAAGVKSEAFGTPAAGTAAARGDAVSPLTQPASQQYTERDNAGKVEASLHPEVAAPPPPEPRALEVDVDEWRATQPIGRHMWERLEDKAEALDRHTHALGRAICAAAGLDEPTNVLRATVEETTAVGRIVCDSEGKINSNSVFLETTRASSAGVRVKLELQDVANYAVFRGQVVAVRGTNARGTAITVREVFSAAPRAPPAPTAGDGGARVLVASGPFTTDDSLTYEPLRDLLDAAERQAVDALVLVGPFVDEAHPAVRSANVGDLTFEIVYRNQVVEMLLRWLKARREASGREPPTIVLCASTADVHAHPTFPQGPLETRGARSRESMSASGSEQRGASATEQASARGRARKKAGER
jgi:DNA polymerase alpha subunit B